MRRIQFYPSEVLEKKLEEDSRKLGVSISTLVVEVLNEHYGLVEKNTFCESQLTKIVMDELKAYIDDPQSDREFDLLKASKSFATIEMTYAGKPSTIRAKIGKKFATQVGVAGPFKNVSIVYKPNGKVKKNSNNATIYKISDERIE